MVVETPVFQTVGNSLGAATGRRSAAKETLKFFGALPQLQPIKEEVWRLQPNAKPGGDFLLFTLFLGPDLRIGSQTLGASLSLAEKSLHPRDARSVVRSLIFAVRCMQIY